MAADLVPLTDFVSVLVPGTPESKLSIKSFVESKGLEFAKGSGFYQLSKPETIQLNKDILVQRLSEPSVLITGKTVREVLKIDKNKNKSGKFMIDDEILKEFKIFIQSTSYNRNLIGGTTFLYRKENSSGVGTSSAGGSGLVTVNSTSVSDNDNGPAPKIPRRTSPGSSTSPSVPAVSAATSPGSSNPARAIGASTKVEVVISFDSTASMYPCLSTVRSVIRDTLVKLTTHIPSIRIGIIAHGDYDTPYIIQAANNYKLCGKDHLNELIDFVTTAGPNPGYTTPECYEYVLREVKTKVDWSADANKSLIMIGDSTPHEQNDNPHGIDWRAQARGLKDMGVRVYAVQALDRNWADSFYRDLADMTMGFHLKLHQFSSITDFLTAVCFHEDDSANNATDTSGQLARYEEEVTTAGRMVNNLRTLFDQLQGREVRSIGGNRRTDSGSTLVPISPSRFQVLTVDADQAIKQFAEARGLVFKAGRGFYQFTKPEAVSDKKEIVLMDKTTGEFFTGWTAARELSGIEAGKAAVKQKPKESDRYLVFIQSTSYNRKLLAGQQFLYEVDPDG